MSNGYGEQNNDGLILYFLCYTNQCNTRYIQNIQRSRYRVRIVKFSCLNSRRLNVTDLGCLTITKGKQDIRTCHCTRELAE